jgi:hypothetical protein
MARKLFWWALMLTLLPACAYGGCMPGQDIDARSDVTFCEPRLVNTSASMTYVDPAGNRGEESPSAPASVELETSVDGVTSNTVTTFVAPDSGARVYFTVSRSFCVGASLAGKCVKVVGRFRAIGGAYYVDDGGALLGIDPATGLKIASPTLVPLRVDLLSSLPRDGDRVIVEGVCRQESCGLLSLLPLADSAIAQVQ